MVETQVKAKLKLQDSKTACCIVTCIKNISQKDGTFHKFGCFPYSARTNIKIGMIQSILARPLNKDNTQIHEAFHIFIKVFLMNRNKHNFVTWQLQFGFSFVSSIHSVGHVFWGYAHTIFH